MRRQTRYAVVDALTIAELERDVQDFFTPEDETTWEVSGGILLHPNGHLMQAMVGFVDEEEPSTS